ncbi:hypothetical protein KIH87_06590 [Paraneptunicella aestuarii]|uniref:YhfG family protein n=1 Tax=Paraneptunicella aestuarii TaxID=2831148 RepID=UPI001E5A1E19|nr:YhfG family protein [Paraneptunicella aestuarii]UAA40011.1 hypothetical protein KIH87_06590 [Paraneptunicella aestuarii]
MSISITKVLNCKNAEELKLLGSYLKLKRTIESELGFKLRVKGFRELFDRIHALKGIVSKKKDELENMADILPFIEAKPQAIRAIGFKLEARTPHELKRMLKSLISLFSNTSFSAYERYEQTKFNNFIHSSRLEGIQISAQSSEQSLESVLAKYRV